MTLSILSSSSYSIQKSSSESNILLICRSLISEKGSIPSATGILTRNTCIHRFLASTLLHRNINAKTPPNHEGQHNSNNNGLGKYLGTLPCENINNIAQKEKTLYPLGST